MYNKSGKDLRENKHGEETVKQIETVCDDEIMVNILTKKERVTDGLAFKKLRTHIKTVETERKK